MSLSDANADILAEDDLAIRNVDADVTVGPVITIPIVAEELSVDKNIVETGRMHIKTIVHEHEQYVDEPLLRKKISVRVVPVNQFVGGSVPAARQEGDIYIVPVLEERLFVEKRLFLKEEIHLTTEREIFHEPQSVTLRQMEVTVERDNTLGHPDKYGNASETKIAQ